MSRRSESTKIFSLRLPCSLTVTLLVAALLVAFHPISSSAQIEWTPEAQISLDDVYDDWFPRVAAGPDGRVWVVWRGTDGYDPEIMYSVNDGNGWSYPARVNTDDYVEDTSPDIAVGPDGNPWVVWSKRVGGSSKLFWSRWEGDGWRTEARVFPNLADEPYAVARMAVEAEGIPWLVWAWPGTEGGQVVCCSRYDNGTWCDADTIVELPGLAGYAVASGPDGRVWTVIPHLHNYETHVLYTFWEAGLWAPVDTIPGATGASTLVVSASAEVWVAWSEDSVVYAAGYSEGEWSEPEVVAAPDTTSPGSATTSAGGADLAVSPDGTLWGAWMRVDMGPGQYNEAIFAGRRVAGAWSPEERVSNPQGMCDGPPQLTLSPSGQAWVVWQGWDGRDFEILYSHSIGTAVCDEWGGKESRGPFMWSPNPMQRRGVLRVADIGEVDGPVLLYDVAGHLIRRLDANPRESPGHRSRAVVAEWAARDQSGRAVPSGTYRWRAQTGGQLYEGTIVVIR